MASLISKGARVFAVDYARAGVLGARAKNPEADFVVADVVQIPAAAAMADVVISNFVLTHLSERGRPAAVAEAHRVLKPAGLFIGEVFSHNDLRAKDRFVVKEGIPYYYFTEGELRRLLSGFASVDVERGETVKKVRGEKVVREILRFVGRK